MYPPRVSGGERSGMLDRLTSRFIPEDFDSDDIEQLFRARVVVALSFAVSVFGPVYAVAVYLLSGQLAQLIATVMATVGVAATPFLMRRGVPFVVLGNWMTLCGVALFVFVASRNLGPSVLMWQVVFAVLLAFIAGRRSALAWLVVMSSLVVYFYLSMFQDAGDGQVALGQAEVLWEMTLIVGMFVAVMVLTLMYETIKTWALDTIRAQAAETRAILESAPDGIVTLSDDGRIEDINAAGESLFDYHRDDIDHAPFATLVPEINEAPSRPADPEHEEFVDGRLFEGEDDREGLDQWTDSAYEADAVRRDGTRFPAELSVTPIEDDQERFVAIVRDITVQKKAERALREARDRAVEANESKSRFLANTSHELRTPLNAIIGYSELMYEDLEMMGEDQLMEDVNKITGAGKHLLGLINEILDLAKLEAGKMELCVEEVELQQLVDELSGTIQPLVEKNNNSLQVDIEHAPDKLRVDQMKLRQILLNLMSNACKFTEDAYIRLHAFEEHDDGQHWCVFEVIDRGIGIPDEKLEQLFQAFTQADASTTRDYGGTGLGLTICKKFTELMGGQISVDSEVGEGSTFRVKLPVEVDEPAAEDAADSDSADPGESTSVSRGQEAPEGAPTVMVIDDDPTVHQLMERFLSREGFNVETSIGGEKALQQARSLDPDIITLDVLMPEVDGWSMLEKLKADDELADIPVVMLTIVSERNMGFSRGATDYLTKPVDTDRLVEVLNANIDGGDQQPVLVVEDDDDTREMLQRTLEKSDFPVVTSADGREALDELESGMEPGAILLDLMMPRMDGFELLEELRASPTTADIPVIVVSAADLTDAERRMLNHHVDQVLKKGSYAREQLIGELRTALRRSHSTDHETSKHRQSMPSGAT